MKTKEFIKRVEELGYCVMNGEEYYHIKDFDGEVIASINKLITFQICTDFNAWDELCDDLKKQLFDIISKYTSTPIDKREEEKMFYLRHRWIFDKDFYIYLQKASYDDREISLGVINFRGNDGLKFTLKEIGEIKKKFNTDLKDFELIEVEE